MSHCQMLVVNADTTIGHCSNPATISRPVVLEYEFPSTLHLCARHAANLGRTRAVKVTS